MNQSLGKYTLSSFTDVAPVFIPAIEKIASSIDEIPVTASKAILNLAAYFFNSLDSSKITDNLLVMPQTRIKASAPSILEEGKGLLPVSDVYEILGTSKEAVEGVLKQYSECDFGTMLDSISEKLTKEISNDE